MKHFALLLILITSCKQKSNLEIGCINGYYEDFSFSKDCGINRIKGKADSENKPMKLEFVNGRIKRIITKKLNALIDSSYVEVFLNDTNKTKVYQAKLFTNNPELNRLKNWNPYIYISINNNNDIKIYRFFDHAGYYGSNFLVSIDKIELQTLDKIEAYTSVVSVTDTINFIQRLLANDTIKLSQVENYQIVDYKITSFNDWYDDTLTLKYFFRPKD